MLLAAVAPLAAWDNFYVIVGSSAGALTGLTFVVVTLVGESREPGVSWGVSTFSTPTVVHFALTLLIAALLSAPWPIVAPASVLLALVGLGGVIYTSIVTRRLRRQVSYQPVMEDWLWHAVFPLAAYLALVVAAILLPAMPIPALFVVGAAMILLVFIGIHNAWDTLTYVAVERYREQAEGKSNGERGAGNGGRKG